MLKSKNDIASAEPTFRRGFKTDAERIAVKCRQEIGLKDFQPLSSFALAKHLNLQVITPTDIPNLNSKYLDELLTGNGANHWSAVTIGREKPTMIIYNSSHSPSRNESNIMHESAHVLLKHSMGEIDTSFGIPLRKYDPVQEMEAEWLGGCLQLPKPALIKHYVYGSYSLKQIAELFTASFSMVRYRLGVSGAMAMKLRFSK